MRPIDYVIKLEAAFGIAPDYFVILTENLYYDDDNFIKEVLTIMKDECEKIYDRMQDIFHQLDECQL